VSGGSTTFQDRLARARRGEASARDELFASCRSFVGLCARAQLEQKLRRKVDASDLVQQSLLDAHRGFERFRGSTPDEWMAWLRRIVSNNALDLIRHHVQADARAVSRERPLEGGPETSTVAFNPFEPAARQETPSQVLMGMERHLELAAAIEQLSEDHREVVYLRNVLGLPFDEVATRMERSRGAVQMLWMRALETLRSNLARESRP